MVRAENFQIGVARICLEQRPIFTGFIPKESTVMGKYMYFAGIRGGREKREKLERNEGFSIRKIGKRCGN